MSSEYRPRSVLVTGGAGFIGANFVHHLIAAHPGIRVLTLDKLTYAGSLGNLRALADPSRHHFVHGDICDSELVTRLLQQHAIDTLVHFAAESHVDRSISGPEAFVRTNVLGTFSLLESARNVWSQRFALDPGRCRFHHVSTDEVYGSLAAVEPAFTETTRYSPNSPYSASKAGSDHLAHAYHHTYGLPLTVSNCSNNYGPLQHAEKFIPTVIRACLQGEPIPVYGDGSNIRDWLYVADHCRGVERILVAGHLGETYNLGGGNERVNIEIARAICGIMDRLRPVSVPHDRLIRFVSDRPGHDWRYAIDYSKATRELAWQPGESFEGGLEKTCRWYLTRARELGWAGPSDQSA
jgi:dTDP-glucose 4,6-dehydratase